MATITASGTWTPLNVDFSKNPKTGPNEPTVAGMQFEQLKQQDLPEITQFLQAMADGYGISFNSAKALFDKIWHGTMNRETPARSRVYAA